MRLRELTFGQGLDLETLRKDTHILIHPAPGTLARGEP